MTTWLEVALGDVALKLEDGPFGSHLKSSHYVDHGVRVVRLQNIGVGRFDDHDAAFVSDEHFARLRKHECRPGDVLIATLGDPIVRACVQPPSLTVALNKADCLRLRCDSRLALPEYVAAYLNSGLAQTRANGLAHGQTRLRVNLSQLRAMPIPLPPIDEQRRIAAVLDQADELRAKRRASLNLFDSLAETIFHDMFETEDLPLQHLSEVLAGADVFIDGDWVESKDQDPAGGVRLIQLADIGDGYYVDKSNRFMTPQRAAELKCTYLRPGDVLVARMPDPLGRACIFPGDEKPCVTVVDVCVVRPGRAGPDPIWLCQALNAPETRRQLEQFATGTTRQRISRKNLGRVQLRVPPQAAQLEFSARMTEAAALRSRVMRASGAQQSLFLSLQQRAFSGVL